MSEKGSVLIVCDDDIIVGFIENVLFKMGINKIMRIPIDAYIHGTPVHEKTDLVIINEVKNTRALLKANRRLKLRYPHLMLVALTSYLVRDFDIEFENSGVNYVLPLDRLHGELTRICRENKLCDACLIVKG